MFWVLTRRFSLPQKVPARVLVVQANAFTRLAVTSAERSRSALTMACVRATAPSAPRRSPRPTSPPATERLKSASTGWVAEEITPWRTGCHSNTVLILASVWSRLSSCSSSAGLLRLHLWEVRARGVYLCQPRWQGWDRALPRVLHGEKWVIYPFSHLLQAGSFFYKYTGEFCLFFSFFFKLDLSLCTANPSTCSSTGSERLARFFNKKVTTLPAGSPCNDFKGYCDVFMKCRLVDADGPLARLKKAIFNPELYENIAEWIVVHVDILIVND